MGCSDEMRGGPATCVCSGTAVFEGAVIGQVFTGTVQMSCPGNDSAIRRCRSGTQCAVTDPRLMLGLALIGILQTGLFALLAAGFIYLL